MSERRKTKTDEEHEKCNAGIIPYQRLANAIIVQAADDYRAVRRWLEEHPRDAKALEEIHDLEQFFLSEWFELLSDADGKALLERLRRE